MTDEERQKLVARFKAHEVVMWTDIDLAADELEQLTITPLGVEAAAHAIRLVNGGSLEECRILARAALYGAFP